MKTKKILLTLFFLYWIIVYGVSFFSYGIRSKINASILGDFMPSGYRMYTHPTQTKLYYNYDYYLHNKKIKCINSIDYLIYNNQNYIFGSLQSFYWNNYFFKDLYRINFLYMQAHYNKETNLFDALLDSNQYLKKIKNRADLSAEFIAEHSNIKADSVVIYLIRKPIFLPFKTDKLENYTYSITDTIIQKTNKIIN